jgi:hypothetical protein
MGVFTVGQRFQVCSNGLTPPVVAGQLEKMTPLDKVSRLRR